MYVCVCVLPESTSHVHCETVYCVLGIADCSSVIDAHAFGKCIYIKVLLLNLFVFMNAVSQLAIS